MLEGHYESVYNARRHRVVEVPGGEGTGMEAYEGGKHADHGRTRQLATPSKKDDSVEQSGAPRSQTDGANLDKACPYSWGACEFNRDCYVNCEVKRAWADCQGRSKQVFQQFSFDSQSFTFAAWC
ncbi:hypothetical protein TcBrA4_0094900 [Trypanosoma cruzi]|nr:hypothetical protein TcBrA4_0094900 [Trypanosoma cruzi]